MKTTALRIVGTTLSLFGQRSTRMLWTMIGMLLGATALSLTAQPAPSTVAGGLVGHWNFDEGSGPVAADSSGYGNDGRLAEGIAWWQSQSPARVALVFDGVNDHVSVRNSPSLNPSDEITLAAWIAPYNLSASGEIIAKSNGTDPQYYLRVQSGGKIRFGISGTVLNGNTTLSPSQWHHVAGTYDGSTMKIYVDGALDATMSNSGPMHDNGVDVWIGCRRFQTPLAFNGLIDDPQIYSRALSANEIQALVTPPQVVITTPNDQTFLPGDVGLITADVINFFAPLTKVDFYEGPRLIGTATEPPYSVVYDETFLRIGRHYIYAVATDTLGNVVSTDPSAFWFTVCDDTYDVAYVKIISPAAWSVFKYGDPILIQVVSHEPCDGLFDGIALYLDSSFLVHQAGNTLDFVLENVPLGSHWIFARTTGANSGFYDELNITVTASLPPTVAITSPTDGAVLTAPADVPVHVTAQDPDGAVVEVELTLFASTDGTTTTFVSTAADFDYTFPSLADGNYALTATATDNTGVTATTIIFISVVLPGPPNDNFANSFDLAQITTGNNVNATGEPGEPPFTHSVWWHWTAPSDGGVVISTAGSSFNTDLGISTGNSVDRLLPIAGPNIRSDISQAAIAQFFANAGTTYQIIVVGLGGASGDIQLNIRYDVPPTVAITSPAEGAVFSSGADILFHVTAQDSDGTVVQVQLLNFGSPIIIIATDFDYTFPFPLAVGNHTLTAEATDNLGAVSTSSVHFTVGPPRPANDDFANSFDLAQITTGNNINATVELGEWYPNGGHSVWWHWTAPSDGAVVISSVGSSFQPFIGVYAGNAVGNLTPVGYGGGPNYPAIHKFMAAAGTTYRIEIDAATPGQTGDIQLNVHYNVLPTVKVTSPSNGDSFVFGTPIHLKAVANDSDGFVSEVGFYISSNVSPPWQFQVNSSPYELDWTPNTRGQYRVSALVFDNDGWLSFQPSADDVFIYVQ